MMSSNNPGPSHPKKAKKDQESYKFKKPLAIVELERYLAESDSEFELSDTEEISSSDEDDNELGTLESFSKAPESETVTTENIVTDELNVEEMAADVSEVVNWMNSGEFKTIEFTKTSGMLVPNPGHLPIDYFNLLVTEEFYQLIIEETNKYAEEVFLSKAGHSRARISQWKPLTIPELKIFLGLTLHMGTIHLPRIPDYWKTDRLFDFKCFSEYMGRDRYLLILRCLHFVTNPRDDEPKPDDRLFKIRSLISYFNNKMAEVYYPQKELSLDESMILWRGKLVFRQYIQNKRHKYGIKLYMLTEPSGLIVKFAVYTGALGDMGGKGHAEKVVLHLMENKLGVGHSLYMDNYYNSYSLSKKLLQNNTYSTGTLRCDRKHFPKDIRDKKLKKGETISRYSNGVMIGKWRDKRDVAYISTEYENTMVPFHSKRGEEKIKPLPVFHYNKCMGGIDRQDQFLAYYPCTRKTLRWYKKLGTHIVQLLLLNSYFLYNKYETTRMSFYDFRMEIIKVLLPEEMHKKSMNKVLHHFISHCEQSTKSKKTLRRKCKYCGDNGIRKDTPFMCKSCNYGFCLDPCFRKFHEHMT